MSMNGDFWNYLYFGHAEGRMCVCYSIDRTIKKLSEVHLTFVINYFELRDEVIKNKEFLWVNAWHVCGGPWRGPFCILIQRLVCVVIVLFWLHHTMHLQLWLKKYKFSRVKNTWCSFMEILLEWKDNCSGVLILWSLLKRGFVQNAQKCIHFMSLRFLLCLRCFLFFEVPYVKEMR